MKKLYIVGVGSGNFEDLTIKANKVDNGNGSWTITLSGG